MPHWNHFRFTTLWILILGLLLPVLMPEPSEAIPAFARKYDLSCGSCHTKPPRLNAFGEAFHMAGFQIPMTMEGEIRKKRNIGRIWSETDLLNIFALRATGNFVESFTGGDPAETNLTLPDELELYLAGTLTQEISYFFSLENESREIEGTGGTFSERSRFGLGREFFLMFNLQPLLRGPGSGDQGDHGPAHAVIHGPMLMAGKVDPSTNFSYPTNRQFLLDLPGRVESGGMNRFTLTPYAFAAKFFGIETGNGDSVEVTRQVLYNTEGDFGLDLHAMLGQFLIQAGAMQGLDAGAADANPKKDPYLMLRMNFGGERYHSGSLSGLVYWGNDTAGVDNELVDWLRYGLSWNIKYRYLDLYGAVIWDKLSDLPAGTADTFDDTAWGLTAEGDYLATDRLLLSLRYDQMNAGGLSAEKADGKVLSLQGRLYLRDNLALYLRDSYNIEDVSDNPLQNFRNLIALGVDLDF
jgi:hypothetical protein